MLNKLINKKSKCKIYFDKWNIYLRFFFLYNVQNLNNHVPLTLYNSFCWLSICWQRIRLVFWFKKCQLIEVIHSTVFVSMRKASQCTQNLFCSIKLAGLTLAPWKIVLLRVVTKLFIFSLKDSRSYKEIFISLLAPYS